MTSALSNRDKLDIDKNIESIGGVVDSVAARQKENDMTTITTNAVPDIYALTMKMSACWNG